MPDVVEVVLELRQILFERLRVRKFDLRPTGDTGPHQATRAVQRQFPRELLDELWPLRTRSDDAHAPTQDVPELRQLVEPRAAQESADARHALIVGRRPARTL